MKFLPSDQARYFIAIIPPSPIFEEALALKNYFKTKYDSKASLNSPPHITIHMPFLWKEKEENELIQVLNEFAKRKEVIPISFDGFGSFPPRVIFISVAENERLGLLQLQLEKYCKVELNLFNAQYKDAPFHPHLTLAFRDLKKIRFAEAWNEFRERPFSGLFEATGFTLLKHDGKIWQPFHQFRF